MRMLTRLVLLAFVLLWSGNGIVSMLTAALSIFAAIMVVIAGVGGIIWWWLSEDPVHRHH